jgi:hypothetical protein
MVLNAMSGSQKLALNDIKKMRSTGYAGAPSYRVTFPPQRGSLGIVVIKNSEAGAIRPLALLDY